MTDILKNISKHIRLTKAEETYFISLLKEKTLQKKDFYLRENEVCLHSVFVLNGCLRGYTVDQNGFEHILQFAPADWWIADMYSLITQKPGNLNIDAIENTDMLLLAREDQEKLFIKVPAFERFFRIITENSLVSSRQRLIDTMSMTAQERYATFCMHYPSLIGQLPQKLIAAYIGVTPEFLSKVRADYAKRK